MTPIKSGTAITKFLEQFKLHCHGVVGKYHAPANYVFRETKVVTPVGPDFLPDQPHSAEHGSVEGELIARLSFDYPLYRNNNKLVYLMLALDILNLWGG